MRPTIWSVDAATTEQNHLSVDWVVAERTPQEQGWRLSLLMPAVNQLPPARGGVIAERHRGHVEHQPPVVLVPADLVEAVGRAGQGDAVPLVELAGRKAYLPVAPLLVIARPGRSLLGGEGVDPAVLAGEEVARLVGADLVMVRLRTPGDQSFDGRRVDDLAEEVAAHLAPRDLEKLVGRKRARRLCRGASGRRQTCNRGAK